MVLAAAAIAATPTEPAAQTAPRDRARVLADRGLWPRSPTLTRRTETDSTSQVLGASRVLAVHPLPRMAGERLKSTMVEVVFGPGEASEPHTHPCPVLGYVLEGAVRMKVGAGAEVTYSAGETFYEAPNQAHLVSANASRTAPAHFLAVFVCDVDGTRSRPLPKEAVR